MAEELPPGTPEVDDPILIADFIRALSIKGAIGRLRVLDVVMPTVPIGNVLAQNVTVLNPSSAPVFRSTDVFSAGTQVAPAANTVLADTTALPAGVYDVIITLGDTAVTVNSSFVIQHRNAANAANLMTIPIIGGSGAGPSGTTTVVFAYEIALNERLRVLNEIAGLAARRFAAFIFARLRT